MGGEIRQPEPGVVQRPRTRAPDLAPRGRLRPSTGLVRSRRLSAVVQDREPRMAALLRASWPTTTRRPGIGDPERSLMTPVVGADSLSATAA